MKTLKILLIVIIPLSFGCIKKNPVAQDKTMGMLSDSPVAESRYVMIAHENDKLQPSEVMKDFKDNPNIMRADIDTNEAIQSGEVQYVKKGDKLYPAEKNQIKKK